MKLWKRNAVVAAIVLFVCVAVYLNWSYQEEGTETGKVLGQATLSTALPLIPFWPPRPHPALKESLPPCRAMRPRPPRAILPRPA